jgi:hypothetical protein
MEVFMARNGSFISQEHTINAGEIVNTPTTTKALVLEESIDPEEGYIEIRAEVPPSQPATYTPKPPEDDTPQWIWDKYKNGGRTS